MSLNPSDVNTAIFIHYQMGPGTIQQQAINEFVNVNCLFSSISLFLTTQPLQHVLSEPCFDYLRTKETLGYSVGLYDTKKKGILGLCIYVMSQANKFSMDHCREKIDLFFETLVLNIMETMSEDDFNEFVRDLPPMDLLMTRDWCLEIVFHLQQAHRRPADVEC